MFPPPEQLAGVHLLYDVMHTIQLQTPHFHRYVTRGVKDLMIAKINSIQGRIPLFISKSEVVCISRQACLAVCAHPPCVLQVGELAAAWGSGCICDPNRGAEGLSLRDGFLDANILLTEQRRQLFMRWQLILSKP